MDTYDTYITTGKDRVTFRCEIHFLVCEVAALKKTIYCVFDGISSELLKLVFAGNVFDEPFCRATSMRCRQRM